MTSALEAFFTLLQEKSLEMCFKILDCAVGPIEAGKPRKKIIFARIALVTTVALGLLGEVHASIVASNL